MKVLLYTEFYNIFKTSGLGKAIEHQMKALEKNNICYNNILTNTLKIDNYLF